MQLIELNEICTYSHNKLQIFNRQTDTIQYNTIQNIYNVHKVE